MSMLRSSQAFGALRDFSEDVGNSALSSPAVTIQIDAAREDGYRRGYDDGSAHTTSELQARAEAEFADRLALEKAAWLEELAQSFGERIDQAFEVVATKLSDSVAGVVRPFVGHHMKEAAIRRLEADLTVAFRDHAVAVLEGPADLVTPVSEALAARNVTVSRKISEETEITIKLDDTTLTSKVGSWLAELDKEVGDGGQ